MTQQTISEQIVNPTNSRASLDKTSINRRLPKCLRLLLAPHLDENEWATMLLAVITISGGLLPEVWANYDRRRIHPTLMLYVICPPAGGKGVISLGSRLLTKINRHLGEDHKAAWDAYEHNMEVYKAGLKSGTTGTVPARPKRKQLLVPGNITSPKLIQQLADNAPMPLVMVETESDVLANSFKSDPGNMMSTLLRQAYHHESIALSRKTNDELVEIDNPKLAMVIAGTDNQIMSIFNSNQDGLYSRFLFLRNNTSMAWRSVKPSGSANTLDDHYNRWADYFYLFWKQTQSLRAEVTFTAEQWDKLNERGQKDQAMAHLVSGEYSISIARRHALMVIRMAMILSFFRRIDTRNGDIDTSICTWKCDDMDFDLAMELAEISFQKSLELFQEMSQSKEVNLNNTKRMAFFSSLPTTSSFTMDIVNRFAKDYNIRDRTKTRWLRQFRENGMLEQLGRGEYRKTAMAAVAVIAVEETDS